MNPIKLIFKLTLGLCAAIGAAWVMSAVTDNNSAMVGSSVAAFVAVLLKV